MKITKRIFSALTAAALMGTMTVGTANADESNDVSALTATEICAQMGIGWNLGNTLDAVNSSDAYKSLGTSTETSWGNPVTTKAMIDAVAKEGFTCVRVPVTWYNHMDSNYTVSKVWVTRVKQIVDWCIEDGMYVILNSHHDEWNRPTESNYTAASKELKTLWTQISNEFKSYDRHLIFEGMNEPRNYSGSDEWNGGTSAMRQVVNKLDADFVSTVRSTGGNNSNRVLMIPSYAASSDYTAMSDLKLPNDNNLIVSVHAYTPYDFALNGSGTSTFSSSMSSQVTSLFNNIKSLFTSKGIPVCIGEFSATNKNNSAERLKWAKQYAAGAKALGVSCMLWDNNVYNNTSNSGESHGWLNRSTCSWYDKTVVDGLVSSYTGQQITPSEPEITVGIDDMNCTVLYNGSMTSSNYTPTEAVKFDFSKMKSGDVIAVKYTGSVTPMLNIQTAADWTVWATVNAYRTENGVSYFQYSDIVAAYTSAISGKTIAGYSASAPIATATQLLVSSASSEITVSSIIYGVPKATTTTTAKVTTTAKTTTTKATNTTTTKKATTTTKATNTTTTKKATTTAKATNTTTTKKATTTTKATNTTTTKKSTTTAKATNTTTTKKATTTTKKATTTTKKVTTTTNKTTTTKAKKKISSAVLSLSKKTYSYTGKAIKPSVTVKYGKTKLKLNTDYTVSYSANVKTGKATITVKGKGLYSGTKTITFNIVPKKAKLVDVKSEKKNTMLVKWKKDTLASGYYIQYSKSKTFKKGTNHYCTLTKNSSVSKTVSKLEKSKTYYVRIRAYKIISGKKCYGSWSTKMTVKIK